MAQSEKATYLHRSSLPAEMHQRNEANLWSILKNFLGKDLSKVTMPVILNEPLSFLQRICEYMEYADILNQASREEDPANRMKLIATFAVSALASNWERVGKPFNPLLGETFELQNSDYKILCEQVSHHPPISAFHAESSDYKFYGSISPKIKFLGKKIEIHPKGTITIELTRWKEAYSWNNVNCCVHNIVIGKLWIEQYGSMEIINHNNGFLAALNFKEHGSGHDLNCVDGLVQDNSKQPLYHLFGKWNEFLKCKIIDEQNSLEEASHFQERDSKRVFSKLSSFKMSSFLSLSIQDNESTSVPAEDVTVLTNNISSDNDASSTLLWKCSSRPECSPKYYHFTNFAMQLNEMLATMRPPENLCPTDSRLRPDIRYLEAGDLDGASREKIRLEEKQRETKRSRKNKKDERWKPRWFEYGTNPHTKADDWLYSGGYWDRNYNNIMDIF